jgi:hypothetical protein
MKKLSAVIAVVAVLCVASSGPAAAAGNDGQVSPTMYAKAEANLLVALQSDNRGLSESAAYMLGELKSSKAIIPLMKMLRESDRESARTIAALALCKIGDARGVYAVKRAAKFDASETVQMRCAWYYDQYVSPGSFGFAAVHDEEGASLAVR